MKKIVPLIVATVTALFVMAGIFFRESLGGWLSVVLNWAIVLSSVALLVVLARLLFTHIGYIARGRQGFIYSLVAVSAFLITLIAGFLFGVDNPTFLKWIAGIMRPLESALLGLVAIVLASLSLKFFYQRGWNALTISFAVSALVFLFLGLGVLQAIDYPPLQRVIQAVEGLPMIGARGLLIGVTLGAILMGMRVLIGAERPYDD
ncbi:MAG TPA: hypothetical protein GXX60_05770 [Anaerolineaceae bacterium]|jgi:hypothetical protein|nr:hypothetical protein [Anaerolineaceae bacterium]